jgi:excisionase family DNA binding protein
LTEIKEPKRLTEKEFYKDKDNQDCLQSALEIDPKFKYSNYHIGQEICQQIDENRIAEKAKKRLSVKELADYLGVAPKTIYGWVYKGLIQPERVGPRLIRFDLEKIEQWILQSKENL